MTSSENFDPARIRAIDTADNKIYGVRVQLPQDSPFRSVIGENWQSVRWYASQEERDQALTEMASEHRYSRRGDRPRLICECVDMPAPQPLFKSNKQSG